MLACALHEVESEFDRQTTHFEEVSDEILTHCLLPMFRSVIHNALSAHDLEGCPGRLRRAFQKNFVCRQKKSRTAVDEPKNLSSITHLADTHCSPQ